MKTLIQKFYLDFSKGNIFEIPEELNIEFQIYLLKEIDKHGKSAYSYSKRIFLRNKYIKENYSEFLILKKELEDLYNSGYGFKRIAKLIDLSYTKTRFLFSLCEIKTRKGQSIVTDELRKLRSENSKKHYKNRTGYFKTFERRTNKSIRGVQGYYYNKWFNKYVWLRSTYEYIFAKWLDFQNIKWDIEVEMFKLKDSWYRPDFFIYKNNKVVKIVEIKGYKYRENEKSNELNKQLNIDVIQIENINPYIINSSYGKELKLWKKVRLNELELKELQ